MGSNSLSASGTVLGQVLESLSPGQAFVRTATNLSDGSIVWSDSGGSTPILLSPDGTLIATDIIGGTASSLVTNIYRDGILISATSGTGEGWIDNVNLLVANYVDTQDGPVYTGSSIVDATGAVVSSIPGTAMPPVQPPQFLGSNLVYDPKTNGIYSITTGQPVWQGPVSKSADAGMGAVAASMVVYEAGHQIVSVHAP